MLVFGFQELIALWNIISLCTSGAMARSRVYTDSTPKAGVLISIILDSRHRPKRLAVVEFNDRSVTQADPEPERKDARHLLDS